MQKSQLTNRVGKHARITYYDHVLFRNTNPNQIEPSIRECSGWIYRENDEAILIFSDRPVKALAHERPDSDSNLQSGFLIMKNLILEMIFDE